MLLKGDSLAAVGGGLLRSSRATFAAMFSCAASFTFFWFSVRPADGEAGV